jgi:hypothetical protein
VDDHDIIGSMDAKIAVVVDKLFWLVLVEELEAVLGRHVIGLDQRLMNAI